MIRYIAGGILLAFIAIGAATVPFGDAAAREQGANIYDHSSGKWVKKRKVYRRRGPAAKFKRRNVSISTKEKTGTIIVDTKTKYLYLVTSKNKAIRYGIGVGREGFGWNGVVRIANKAKWPSWTPPKEMVEREWKQNKRKVGFMKGGPKNPLGARALYLHQRKGGDTGYRIHGTNEPWSIGLNMSSGCIRLMNKDIEHLYQRAKKGAKVVVIGPKGKNRKKYYSPRTGLFATLFN